MVFKIFYIKIGLSFIKNLFIFFFFILDINVSPTIYGYLIRWLNTLANGRLILCEQDTNDTSTYRKECLLECSKALLGKQILKLCVKNKNISSLETKQYLEYSVKNHINVWKSLQY